MCIVPCVGIGTLYGMNQAVLEYLMCKHTNINSICMFFSYIFSVKVLIAFNFHNCNSIKGTNFCIVTQDDDQVEVSFTRMWDPSLQGKLVPLNIDKRYTS
jgi:Rhamnogalacturonate lyase family